MGLLEIILIAIGLSMDAFAVSIMLGLSVTTFCISISGVKIGNIFGTKYKSKAEFIGGAILVILGVKILMEHLIF
jgi:putative Mn2+ efflux pump MntP